MRFGSLKTTTAIAAGALLASTMAGSRVASCEAQEGPIASPPSAQAPAPAAPAQGKASIAIVPFEASPQVWGDHAEDAELLYDSLLRLLVKSNKFDVLERTRMTAVIDENHFASTSLGDPANLANLGKLTGAQYLLVGKISDLGVRTIREAIPYTSEYKCTESARLRMEVRVVQSRTGKIVSAESAGDSSDPAVHVVSCSRTRETVLDDTMNRVAAGLVGRIVDRIYPITVIHVSGEELTLNRGEGGTISAGTALDCYTQGEAIVDPATGETLGSDETLVGSIRIQQVLEKLSKARTENSASVPVGAVCRAGATTVSEKPKPSAPKVKVHW